MAVFPTPILPPKPEGMAGRDYLIMMLQIASELEHSLMVQYLYAAYSLGGEQVKEHSDLVRTWRDSILTIAREEMGHLITVQNALVLVGGPVTFEREALPWSSPYYPFPFKLERFTLESLARYVYAEMPPVLELRKDKKVQERVMRIVGSTKAPAVGAVYQRIIELLGDEKAIPDSIFDPASSRIQSSWDEMGRGYRPGNHQPYAKDVDVPPAYERKTRVIVTQITTRTQALAALRDVAGQGEMEHLNPHPKTEPSHFDRFAEIFRQFERILQKKSDFCPSRPVPDNPFAGQVMGAPDHVTTIKAPVSRAWGRLFDIRYRMLLSLLSYMYRVPRDSVSPGHAQRPQVLSRMFGEMYNMKAIAGILVRLPLNHPKDERRAGPPFQLPYTLVAPLSDVNLWRMHLDLFDECGNLVEILLRDHSAEAPADGERYLRALRETDQDARVWVEKVLEGLNLGRGAFS